MAEGALRVVARAVVRPERVDEVRGLLMHLVETTRQEAGCVSYEVLQGVENPAEFVVVEEWAGEAAFQAHMGSAHTQAFLAHMPSVVTEEPTIRVYRQLA